MLCYVNPVWSTVPMYVDNENPYEKYKNDDDINTMTEKKTKKSSGEESDDSRQ